MNNFIYSVNATIPIFLVILVGYFLREKKVLNENFVSVANKFNFQVTLPALLFQDIAGSNIIEVFDVRYVLFCVIVTSITFWGIWCITKLFMKDKTMTGAFVQASFRGSAAILGIAFIQNIYGSTGMAPLMIVGSVPLYNMYSVIVLTFEAKQQNKNQIKQALINIVKNPIILAIGAGLIGSIINFYDYCPIVLTKTVHNLAVMASPLALITIGAAFEGKKALAKLKPTIIASTIKLMVLPAIFLPIAIAMGFHDEKMVALLVMLGAPTTVSCYIMAKSMDNDEVLTSSIIVMTTLMSSVTLTFWIYLLKSFGYV